MKFISFIDQGQYHFIVFSDAVKHESAFKAVWNGLKRDLTPIAAGSVNLNKSNGFKPFSNSFSMRLDSTFSPEHEIGHKMLLDAKTKNLGWGFLYARINYDCFFCDDGLFIKLSERYSEHYTAHPHGIIPPTKKAIVEEGDFMTYAEAVCEKHDHLDSVGLSRNMARLYNCEAF